MVGNLGKGLGTVNLVEEWEKGLGTVNLVEEWEKGLGTVNSMGVWGREHGPGASVEDWDDKPNRPHYHYQVKTGLPKKTAKQSTL